MGKLFSHIINILVVIGIIIIVVMVVSKLSSYSDVRKQSAEAAKIHNEGYFHNFLFSIALAEQSYQEDNQVYIGSNAENFLEKMAPYHFQPRPNMAFQISLAASDQGAGYVVFITHPSVGSTVYMHHNYYATGSAAPYVKPSGKNPTYIFGAEAPDGAKMLNYKVVLPEQGADASSVTFIKDGSITLTDDPDNPGQLIVSDNY